MFGDLVPSTIQSISFSNAVPLVFYIFFYQLNWFDHLYWTICVYYLDYRIAYPLFSVAWNSLAVTLSLRPSFTIKVCLCSYYCFNPSYCCVNITYTSYFSINTLPYFVHPFLHLSFVFLTTLSTSEDCEPCRVLCTLACNHYITFYHCWQFAVKSESKLKSFLLFFCDIFYLPTIWKSYNYSW